MIDLISALSGPLEADKSRAVLWCLGLALFCALFDLGALHRLLILLSWLLGFLALLSFAHNSLGHEAVGQESDRASL